MIKTDIFEQCKLITSIFFSIFCQVSQAHPRKPILRSSSLGSWDSKTTQVSLPKVNENNNKEPVRRSGRFSVSPVPDSDSVRMAELAAA